MRFQKLRVAEAVTRAALLIAAATIVLAAGVSAQSASPASSTRAAARSASGDRVAVPEPTPQALAYQRSGTILWLFNTVWALVLPAILLGTGWSARMRDRSARVGRRWFFVIALFGRLHHPDHRHRSAARVRREFMRQHPTVCRPRRSPSGWRERGERPGGHRLRHRGALLWVPYLLLERSPRRWWLYTDHAAAPFIALVQLVAPIWIDPLFDRFGPMQDKALEAQIRHLADRAGSRVAAYSGGQERGHQGGQRLRDGPGATKRIVLWDHLMALDRPQ